MIWIRDVIAAGLLLLFLDIIAPNLSFFGQLAAFAVGYTAITLIALDAPSLARVHSLRERGDEANSSS